MAGVGDTSSSESLDEEVQLSEEQTAQVAHFHDVIGADVDECTTILKRHDWDFERAVHDTFNERDGIHGVYNEPTPEPEPPGPVDEPDLEPQLIHRHINPQADIPQAPPLPLLMQDRGPLNFTARPNEAQNMSWLTWSANLLMIPIRFSYSTLFDIFQFILGLFLPVRRIEVRDPVGDVEAFIATYESSYGENHPVFYRGSFNMAWTDVKRELKFLIVYLHEVRDAGCQHMCSRTLTDPSVINFINTSNSLFWGCGLDSAEGQRVSMMYSRYRRNPFVMVLIPNQGRMTLAGTAQGDMPTEEFLQALRTIVDRYETHLVRARVEREEQQFNRTIREEQDAAYLESERQDAEKERMRLEEIDRKQAEEDESKRQEEEGVRLKEQYQSELPPEPEAVEDSIRILIRLPNAVRIERRFHKSDSTKFLYYLVFCHEEAPTNFEIATNCPRKVLQCKPTSDFEPPTFEELGIPRNESVFVRDLDA